MKAAELITISRGRLAAAYFGFASAIGQVLLIREMLAVFRGNEFIIGMIFAGWFFGVFLGARFSPMRQEEAGLKSLTRCAILFPLILLGAVYLSHALPVLFPRTAGGYYDLTTEFLLALLLTAPASFCVGFFFPIAVALSDAGDSRAGGVIYLWESLGSFAGGVLFSFVLVLFFNPLGITLMLLALALLLRAAVLIPSKRTACLPPLAILCLIPFSNTAEQALFETLWARSRTGILTEYQRTRHQMIQVEKTGDQINFYGDGMHISSLPDNYETRGLFHLIQALKPPQHPRILLIGGGPGSLAGNLLAAGADSVSCCETDPDLLRLISSFAEKLYGRGRGVGGCRMISEDPRHFLRENRERFDLILCASPLPENALTNRSFTVEFFRLCLNNLAPDGIFLLGTRGFETAMGSLDREYRASVYRSFRSLFPSPLFTTGDPMYLAGKADGSPFPAPAEIIRKYRQNLPSQRTGLMSPEVSEGFRAEELLSFFEPSRLDYFKNTIEPLSEQVPVNRDDRPNAFWKSLLLSALQEGSLLYEIFRKPLYPLIGLSLVSLLLVLYLHRRYGPMEAQSGIVIACIGFTGISLVLILMTLYQNYQGMIYSRISLISALFMLGLAAGSGLALRGFFSSVFRALLLLLCSLGAILIYMEGRWEWLFWMILVVVSFQCGAVFTSLYAGTVRDDPHTTASNLDAMDFYGSLAGSAGTALLLIPAFGIRVALGVNALVLGIALLAVLYSRFRIPGRNSSINL